MRRSKEPCVVISILLHQYAKGYSLGYIHADRKLTPRRRSWSLSAWNAPWRIPHVGDQHGKKLIKAGHVPCSGVVEGGLSPLLKILIDFWDLRSFRLEKLRTMHFTKEKGMYTSINRGRMPQPYTCFLLLLVL